MASHCLNHYPAKGIHELPAVGGNCHIFVHKFGMSRWCHQIIFDVTHNLFMLLLVPGMPMSISKHLNSYFLAFSIAHLIPRETPAASSICLEKQMKTAPRREATQKRNENTWHACSREELEAMVPASALQGCRSLIRWSKRAGTPTQIKMEIWKPPHWEGTSTLGGVFWFEVNWGQYCQSTLQYMKRTFWQ